MQDLQDFVQDLARKIFAWFAYSLQDGFYWVHRLKSQKLPKPAGRSSYLLFALQLATYVTKVFIYQQFTI